MSDITTPNNGKDSESEPFSIEDWLAVLADNTEAIADRLTDLTETDAQRVELLNTTNAMQREGLDRAAPSLWIGLGWWTLIAAMAIAIVLEIHFGIKYW